MRRRSYRRCATYGWSYCTMVWFNIGGVFRLGVHTSLLLITMIFLLETCRWTSILIFYLCMYCITSSCIYWQTLVGCDGIHIMAAKLILLLLNRCAYMYFLDQCLKSTWSPTVFVATRFCLQCVAVPQHLLMSGCVRNDAFIITYIAIHSSFLSTGAVNGPWSV